MDIEESMPLPAGATPLDPDETEGLIPELTTRSELNFYEQSNIAKAILWSRTSRKLKQNLLSIESLCLLHRTMFDETWRWSGQFMCFPEQMEGSFRAKWNENSSVNGRAIPAQMDG